jgi:RNA polymerase sigma-70 factor (ECF subfamily)
VVLAAGHGSSPDREKALATLCETYWRPLYAFVRRQGHNAVDAQDLTQAFFTRILETDDFAGLHPDRGRFRSFLLASMRHFLANEWDRRKAQKRGGDIRLFSIDFEGGENRYMAEPADPRTPEIAFDREWALTLLNQVHRKLREKYAQKGQARLFDKLKDLLTGAPPAESYGAVAADLEMTEGAVRVALHRLRRRFGELLRAEIAETVAEQTEIDDELRLLFTSLRA